MSKIDFQSAENNIILNPRWPRDDYESLWGLAEKISVDKNLQSHFWLATSGSTADSVRAIKLVALAKTAVLNSAKAVNAHLQASDKDVWTQVLPRFHVGGLGIEARAHLSGARVVPALKDERWDVKHYYQILEQEKCTLAALVPTQVFDLVTMSLKAPSSLRALVVGGGALDLKLYRSARDLGWPLLPSYGMSETCSQIATASLNSLHSKDFPSVPLLSHAKARTNAEGYLEVTSTSLFTCYAKNTEEGSASWDPKVEGWFTTEDLGEIENGGLQVGGRKSDYIKIGGEGTNLARLRRILEACALDLNSAWPLQVTLLEVPSERLGAEIEMICSLRPEEAEILSVKYQEKVLPFEKVRRIKYVDQIPRTDLGKILWGELRRK